MKIGVTIFVLFVGFMLIGCSAAIHSFYLGSEDTLKKEVYAHLETTAQSRAAHIETFVEEGKDKVKFISTGPIIANFLKSEDDEDSFEKVTKRLEKIEESSSLLNKNGIVIASNREESLGVDYSEEEFFLGDKKESIVGVYYNPITDSNSVEIVSPVLDTDTGEFLGALEIDLKLDVLNQITADKTGLGETGEVYLINKDGYMITPSRFMPEKASFLKQKVDTINSRECLGDLREYGSEAKEHDILEKKGGEVRTFLDYRGADVLGTDVPIPEMQWCLLAEIDEAEALGELKIQLIKSALMSLIIMVFFIFLAEYVIRGLVKQIYFRGGRK